MANLLSSYPGKAMVLSGNDYFSKIDPAFHPPCESRQLLFPKYFPKIHSHMRIRNPYWAALAIKWEIKKYLRTYRPTAVIGTFPWDIFLVASFLACRELGIPFFPHMHDLWSENVRPDSVTGKFAGKWEPIVIKNSAGLFCMTEAMQEHYGEKYGSVSFLLPHTISEEDFLRAPTQMVSPKSEKPTVLFVGAVDPAMNQDALKVLAAASELLPREYQLLFCTASDANELRNLGIASSRLQARYVSRKEVQRLQSESHVLLAPLSHKNCSRDEVRTVFSTKLLEYLVSGRPILVFAPEESFHVRSARSRGWAYTVTEDSPEALAKAIVEIVDNPTLAARLVEGALGEARSRLAKQHAHRLGQWIGERARPSVSSRGHASKLAPRLA
jgi:glycosyltransferase involved in cell wall biosynthesis